jgi:RimJ/RimL family protein N-acetyltransferase
MIETHRLSLRPWRKSNLPVFAEQNADPVVMQFLNGVLTRDESDAYVERAEKTFSGDGVLQVGCRSSRYRALHRCCRTYAP